MILDDLLYCARCGENHKKLEFKPFTRRPAGVKVAFTHFAICPKTQEPILMEIFGEPKPTDLVKK